MNPLSKFNLPSMLYLCISIFYNSHVCRRSYFRDKKNILDLSGYFLTNLALSKIYK